MPTEEFIQNRTSNQVQTFLLILAMTGLLGLTGFLILGWFGFLTALGLLIVGILFSKQASAAMVLRLYKARPIGRQQAPQMVQMFEELCRRANLGFQPTLHYVPSRMPNAFACGTGNDAGVAITDGLIRMLNSRELAGVLAHEIAHIRNDDLRVLGTADAISRTVSFLSRIGFFLVLLSISGTLFGDGFLGPMIAGILLFIAPTAVVLLQLAVSRTREFNADLGAAELTHDPDALASALLKLEKLSQHHGLIDQIFSPGRRRSQPAMLRTHPATDERVERLMSLGIQPPRIDLPPQPSHRVLVRRWPRIEQRPAYHWMSGLWY